MKLLSHTHPSELPTEALLARLRCRRAGVDLAAEELHSVPSVDVVSWVYTRLNNRLRKRLEPFLDLLATRNLVLLLRYTLAGGVPPAIILNNSYLDEELRRLAVAREDAEAIVAQIEVALSGDYPFVVGLTTTYRNQGPGGVEFQLAEGILQHGWLQSNAKIIKATLGYLIDMRNCLMINKLWRWKVNQQPPLVQGGSLMKTSLQRVWAARDSGRLAKVTAQLAGEPSCSVEATGMEQCLMRGLVRRLHREGRDPLGLALIVEYLWLAQLSIHNQLLRQGLAIDREELLEEVLLL